MSEEPRAPTSRSTYGFIALSVLSQVAAATLFKVGAQGAVGRVSEAWWGVIWTWLNPFFVSGLMCLGVQTVAWMMVLRRMPLSRAYPFMACVLPLNLVVAALYFSEQMAWNHGVGIVLICLGVITVARSGTSPSEVVS